MLSDWSYKFNDWTKLFMSYMIIDCSVDFPFTLMGQTKSMNKDSGKCSLTKAVKTCLQANLVACFSEMSTVVYCCFISELYSWDLNQNAQNKTKLGQKAGKEDCKCNRNRAP